MIERMRVDRRCEAHHQVANDGCVVSYVRDDTVHIMADNYLLSSREEVNKWVKKYKRYRSGRTRLYICMVSSMLLIALCVVCATFLFNNSFYLQPSGCELSNGDVRAVSVSTLFCQSIVVKKASFNRRVTVVSRVKRYHDPKPLLSTDAVILRRDRYWYRAFYLLKGSVVDMRLLSRHSINVYWLKGRRTLDKWKVEMKKVIGKSRDALRQFTATSMRDTFYINDDDNYYLGFTSTAGDMDYSEVFVNTSARLVVYDTTTSYKTQCNATTGKSCQVQLDFNSRVTALIEVDDTRTDQPMQDFWVFWFCEPRIWFYAAVFGGIFLIGNIILLLIYCCVLSKIRKKLPNQKPSVIPSLRADSFNARDVRLRSMNNYAAAKMSSNSTFGESSQERPLLVENHRDPEDKQDGVDNGTTVVIVRAKEPGLVSHELWGSQEPWDNPMPPSPPRWSTFLRDHPYSNADSSQSTSPSASNSDLTHNATEARFAKELSEQLKRLGPGAENTTFIGPEETDIDDDPQFNNFSEHSQSEFEPFVEANDHDSEDYCELQDPVRRREARREQRWVPRLSMVTEV